jgi:hypothetical protein
MSDAAIFATVFVSIFVLRILAATLVFYWIDARIATRLHSACSRAESVDG